MYLLNAERNTNYVSMQAKKDHQLYLQKICCKLKVHFLFLIYANRNPKSHCAA